MASRRKDKDDKKKINVRELQDRNDNLEKSNKLLAGALGTISSIQKEKDDLVMDLFNYKFNFELADKFIQEEGLTDKYNEFFQAEMERQAKEREERKKAEDDKTPDITLDPSGKTNKDVEV